MPYLTAAVVVVGTLCLINLLLTFGLIRRVQGQPAPSGPRDREADHLVPPGSTVDAFTVSTVDGVSISPATLAVPTLVGFFAPGCPPCAQLLPAFVAAAGGGGLAALAVVADAAEDDDWYVDRLSTVGQVVRGDQAQPIVDAFAVSGFPAVCLLGAAGVVLATGGQLLRRPRAVSA